ncbi:FAD-dependent oxidoreductase (plasmid) [Thioclava sp. 'Guangxiensis']|uniref:FAD-dependent oxidoreductase n=1 Tax=Thioclava sp. 'Guangxiensis' TaxID=3149044 RepID=UPI0032C49776
MSALVAILGSGPSGFYAAEALLDAGHRVDLYERLPVPFGLVRHGVAPDHPKLKSVTRLFEGIAARPGLRFLGNVTVGRDLPLDQLRWQYDAVILAIGAEEGQPLGIPGDDLPGSHTARDFVGWYNGHPDHRDLQVDLSQDRALVVGQGNVALDVARILLQPVDALRGTDIADHALEQLAESRLREVLVIGRRGPAQARFTAKELREFGSLPGVNVTIPEDSLTLGPACTEELAAPTAALTRSMFATFPAIRDTAPGAARSCRFLFNRQPLALEGPGRLRAAVLGRTRLEGPPGAQRAVAIEEKEVLPCGLVVGCIGYRVRPLPGLATEDTAIPNLSGRVSMPAPGIAGLYVTGWAKRGASGTIGTNRGDSLATVSVLLADLPGHLPVRHLPEAPAGSVGFDQWRALDLAEQAAGRAVGRPRRKATRVADMLAGMAVPHHESVPT